ncbi:MAG: cobalamin biosynthesis protein CobW [Alphaproteobacteria bacterium]|nr:cobalamin biosynthesis protein CobW [Alphaproteobacteria bacterium]
MSYRGKIPTTVITGFLGAGKTTLVRHLVETAGGRRLALIINEFGEQGVDGDLLAACGIKGCGEDDIIELANGCLCCTVADEFAPTLQRLFDRALPPEHIVIETSGLALPKPLVKAFEWPAVRNRATVDGVVAMVDARAVADGTFATDPEALARQRAADPALDHDNPLEEVYADQLACADVIVVNKTDQVDAATRDRVIAEIRRATPRPVPIVATAHARIDAAVLLGLGAAAEDDLAARPSRHDAAGLAHEHDDFESFSVGFAAVVDPDALHARIAAALAAHSILRLKGFVAVADRDARHVVQAVGTRLQGFYDRPWKAGEARESRLVVIGLRGLDRPAIARAILGT